MIDRFMTFESGAFNAHHQINQINAKRATLTRNSMTCLIVQSFGFAKPPNGLRYPLVGGTRQRRFDGIGLSVVYSFLAE
jgi:hypothetical protein